MKTNVWSAWWRNEFDAGEYIYHYTKFENALKILHSNQFRLSPLSETNDTTEQKVRIVYDLPFSKDYRKQDFDMVEEYWEKWTSNSKLMCFSQDIPKRKSKSYRNTDPFDIKERGFALPRMWAQYANNNCGICFIIHKDEFLKKIKYVYPESICKNVSYYNLTDGFKISEDAFEQQYEIIKNNPRTHYASSFVHESTDFANYYYFSKYKDWEGEREFRVLIPSDDSKCLYVDDIKNLLAGLVVGEYMDPAMICAIKSMLPDKIPMRKIVFGLKRCSVESIAIPKAP